MWKILTLVHNIHMLSFHEQRHGLDSSWEPSNMQQQLWNKKDHVLIISLGLQFIFIPCFISFSYHNIIQLPVKYPSFFENVPKINIGIEEVRIQSYRLLKMVNGKPNLSLSIKNASKIAPCNSKIRSSFDGFQVTSLILVETDVYVWRIRYWGCQTKFLVQ